jgi:hypothetical protein
VTAAAKVGAIATIALVGVLALAGASLSRIDQLHAEQRAAAAQVRLLEARVELVRVLGSQVRAPADPRVEVLVRRTDALRGAIFALVRTGAVSMPGDPGGDWVVWPLELAEVSR